MSFLDRFISVIAPFECLGCGSEGCLICVDCTAQLAVIPSRCYHCRKLTTDFRTCTSCRSNSKLYALQPRTIYSGVAKSLVGRLKFYGAQSAAKEIAKLLSTHALPEGCIVVPVPTATSRARQRGYDQAKRIARDFARHNNLPYLDCLARIGQSHQVGARRSQRIKQLRNAYRVKSGMRVKGIEIILIDDVLTTGATLEAAAACLKASGAKRICAQTFTQA